MSDSGPPEEIDGGEFRLVRHRPELAPLVAQAVTESLDHLAPWMPWAGPQAGTVDAVLEHAAHAHRAWDAGTEYTFAVVPPEGDRVLGMCGLHRRVGEGGLEIGYWVHAGATGRGLATRMATLLRDAALRLDGIQRVEIHCDQANVRSNRVAEKAGFRRVRAAPDEIAAPGEVGIDVLWVYD